MAQAWKKYQKKAEYSYTFGAFPTFELLKKHPETVEAVYVHSAMDNAETMEKLSGLCREHHIRLITGDKTVEKLREKDSVVIIGIFRKYAMALSAEDNHVVLVNPSDMGNLGTILRTALGFGLHDIAIVEPAADLWNPKVIRASMGAAFSERVHCFASFADYEAAFGSGRTFIPFVLEGRHTLQEQREIPEKYALIFGNEATGLPKEFDAMGNSMTIRQSPEVDSFNLSLAAGIAMYEFTRKGFIQ